MTKPEILQVPSSIVPPLRDVGSVQRLRQRFFPGPWEKKGRVTVSEGMKTTGFDSMGSSADPFALLFDTSGFDRGSRVVLPLGARVFRMWMSLLYRDPMNPQLPLRQAIAWSDSADGVIGWFAEMSKAQHIQFKNGITLPTSGPESGRNETFSAVWVDDSRVSPPGGQWFGYYTGTPGTLAQGLPGEYFDIYLATTTDPTGKRNWVRHGVVLSPEITSGSWEGGRWATVPPEEVINGGGLSEPSVLWDARTGRFLLWYANIERPQLMGQPGAKPQIGLATSTKGLTEWVREPSNPVLRLGRSGEWDDAAVTHCHVVADPEGGYHLFYHGNGSGISNRTGLGHAFSVDGVNWTKNPRNPIVRGGTPTVPGTPGSWDEQVLGPCGLILSASAWRLYYWGRRIIEPGPPMQFDKAYIGYAEAPRLSPPLVSGTATT